MTEKEETIEEKIYGLIDELVEMEEDSPKKFIEGWIEILRIEEYGCPMHSLIDFHQEDIPNYFVKSHLYQEICNLQEDDDDVIADSFNKYDEYLLERLEEMYDD